MNYVRTGVLMAVTTKITVFWKVTLCNLVFTNILQEHAASIFYPENVGSNDLRNTMISHPRRQYHIYSHNLCPHIIYPHIPLDIKFQKKIKYVLPMIKFSLSFFVKNVIKFRGIMAKQYGEL
jgi:hypothetical protein